MIRGRKVMIKLGFGLVAALLFSSSALAQAADGWKTRVDEDGECTVSNGDDQMSVSVAGRAVRVQVLWDNGTMPSERTSSPIALSFRGANGKPNIIWKDVGYRYFTWVYSDFSLDLEDDSKALYYFSNATVMDATFEKETRKFALNGTKTAMTSLIDCVRVEAEKGVAESKAVLENLLNNTEERQER
jgi:hypothetical protein